MNLVPGILGMIYSWEIPSGFNLNRTCEIVRENPEYYRSLCDDLFFQITDLNELIPETLTVGLYYISYDQWREMTSNIVRSIEPLSSGGDATIIRSMTVNGGNSVLIFPDDLDDDDFNISFFSPSISDNGNIVLNSLKVGVDIKKQIKKYARIFKGGCTPSITGDFPNRKFDCCKTGCGNDCRDSFITLDNLVETYICRC